MEHTCICGMCTHTKIRWTTTTHLSPYRVYGLKYMGCRWRHPWKEFLCEEPKNLGLVWMHSRTHDRRMRTQTHNKHVTKKGLEPYLTTKGIAKMTMKNLYEFWIWFKHGQSLFARMVGWKGFRTMPRIIYRNNGHSLRLEMGETNKVMCHTYIHKYILIHTYTHTNTYRYIHTYKYILIHTYIKIHTDTY